MGTRYDMDLFLEELARAPAWNSEPLRESECQREALWENCRMVEGTTREV
jgi:hypothetical protein